MKKNRGIYVLLPLLVAACASPTVRNEVAEVGAKPYVAPEVAAATITAEDIHRRIAFLASDEMRGRDTPSPELERAAAYIADEFRGMGLDPAGEDGTYFQYYALQSRALDAEATQFRVEVDGRSTTLEHGEDYFAFPGVPNRIRTGMVFTGTEIEDGMHAAVRDRAAVVYLPGLPTSPNLNRQIQRVQAQAQAAGVAALVFVLDPEFPAQDIARMATLNATPRGLSVGEVRDRPIFFVRYAAARTVFGEAGLELDALRGARAAAPVEVPAATAQLAAPVAVHEDHRAPNVAAVLPGSDPELRETYVVFSAHFDHVGVGRPDESGDSIYNGADDNASGTAALLEVAQAFASLPEAPARSLVFLAVSGEEKGLLGSAYYADNPTVPLEGMVANINVDMIGRNAPDSIVVIGQEYSSLGPLVQEVAASRPELGLTVSRDLWPEQRFFFRSDHFNFARQDIPALFFFAGIHEDYHRPSDHVEKIDTDKTARVAQLVFYTAYEIASRPEPPRWTEEGLREMRELIGRGR